MNGHEGDPDRYRRGSSGTDYVDGIVGQWEVQRPDLDVWPIGIIGRVKRLTSLLNKLNESVWAEFGLDEGLFDVLAALRRSGAPHLLSPTQLYNSLFITSGTMTHRLSRLAADGLIERVPNPHDRRGMLVQLTENGLATVDAVMDRFVAQGNEILDGLADRAQVTGMLRALLVSMGDTGAPEPSLAAIDRRRAVAG